MIGPSLQRIAHGKVLSALKCSCGGKKVPHLGLSSGCEKLRRKTVNKSGGPGYDAGTMGSPRITLRPAVPFDADGIARVHVQCWRDAYTGIIPAERLAAMSVAERAQRWRHILTLPAPDEAVFVAMQEGAVVGFGDCGRQRSPQLDYAGEFNAIYVLKEIQRAGVGRQLMAAMRDHLQTCGIASASLWVVKENEGARAFYEALGGQAIAEKTEHRESYTLNEVAYGWRDLETMGRE
jgi:ribosomal protein S18 acetylase RimI-like enzyme